MTRPAECRYCFAVECDPEIHAATLRIRRYLRWKLERAMEPPKVPEKMQKIGSKVMG